MCVGLLRWGVALRLRESFLLFIWGVPLGDALGMTFVESLTPTRIHTHSLTDTQMQMHFYTHTHTHIHTHLSPLPFFKLSIAAILVVV